MSARLECGCAVHTWTVNDDGVQVTALNAWRDDYGIAWQCPLHGWSAELLR